MSALIRTSVQRMHGYVPGEQPRNPDIVKLNTNENPYPPSPRVTAALQSTDSSVLARYPDPVSTGLRERIAGLHGCGVGQVFVGNGSDEALALCTRSFVEDDGSVGYFEPSYSLYPVLAAIRDVATRPVELGGDFEWQMADDYACSLFFLTNPNAPTGIRYPKDVVARFCSKLSGVVVVDEAYVDFADDNCADLALRFENVLVARTLSKSFSLAGLRVGYVLGAPPLIDALLKTKDSYNVNVLSQRLALAALSDMDHMRSNVEKIRRTRARLSDALEAKGFHVCPSQTNFVWVQPKSMPAKDLFDRLRELNILVRHFEGDRTGQFLRITVGTDAEIDALLDAVTAIVGTGAET